VASDEWYAAQHGVEDDDVQHPEYEGTNHGSVMMMKVMSAPMKPTRAHM